jgi:DNA-binding transcriptional LysR family regulator
LNDVAVFLRVVDTGFTRAALSLAKSAVSRKVARLEEAGSCSADDV